VEGFEELINKSSPKGIPSEDYILPS